MMKKYHFRLEAVLKVRKIKEENCRMELGKLIVELAQIDGQIKHDQTSVESYYKIQEASLNSGARAHQVRAFPMLVEAKTTNIQSLLKDRKNQERLIEEKKQELASLRGELKVIENLKEKDYTEFRKAINKEIDQTVEEQTQNWMRHKEQKV